MKTLLICVAALMGCVQAAPQQSIQPYVSEKRIAPLIQTRTKTFEEMRTEGLQDLRDQVHRLRESLPQEPASKEVK